MRVVVDTNVVVSRYLVPQGKPARILSHWEEGDFDLLVSEPILDECRRVLRYDRLRARHGMNDAAIEQVIVGLRTFATMVVPRQAIRAVDSDPDDDKFLECAVAGGAEFVVSGDRHLLDLGSYQGIQILPPAAFLAYLETGIDGE